MGTPGIKVQVEDVGIDILVACGFCLYQKTEIVLAGYIYFVLGAPTIRGAPKTCSSLREASYPGRNRIR